VLQHWKEVTAAVEYEQGKGTRVEQDDRLNCLSHEYLKQLGNLLE
jgi:hypothetical protein